MFNINHLGWGERGESHASKLILKVVKTPQCSNTVLLKQPTLLVSTNALEQREVWQQSEVASYARGRKGGKRGRDWLFPVTDSRIWAEESRGHMLTALMTKRDYQDVFPSEVMR